MEISITWNICRVCLKEDSKNPKSTNGGKGQMRKIFEDKNMAKQIYECSGIKMKPNDSLPEKICRECIAILEFAINFRKTCRNSDSYLQSVLQRTKSASFLFKPERPPDLEDELGSDINYDDDEEEEEQEEEHVSTRDENDTEEEYKTVETIKRKPNKQLNKFSINEDDSNTEEIGIIHLPSKIEVVEQIPENTENMMNEIFSNEYEENIRETPGHSVEEEETEEAEETENHEGELKRFYDNASYEKIIAENPEDHENIEEDEVDEEESQESKMQILKEREELYYILKGVKIENRTQAIEQVTHDEHTQQQDDDHIIEMDEQEHHQADNDIDFLPIDTDEEQENDQEEDDLNDSMVSHLEDDFEDNQSQVTSTTLVNNKQEVINDEERSNLSYETNDLPTEYIIDEFIKNEDCNSNSFSQNINNANAQNKWNKIKPSTNLAKAKARLSYKFGGRKIKNNHASASSSSGSQTCVCTLCGNQFSNRQMMNLHMKVHRQEKNHECEICFKRFITACNLQAHMRIHTGEKPFECQFCGRRFSDRSSNLRHERTHTNEKPFKCDDCGKTFTLSTTLQAHMKVHTGERSYRCELCVKSFKLPHQLKAHQNSTLHRAVEQLDQVKN